MVYLLKGEGAVFEYNLRYAAGSLRKVNRALTKLEASHRVSIRGSSVGKKKLYQVTLTGQGKLVAANLVDIERERGAIYSFQDIHLNMLARIYSSKSESLADLSQVEYFDEGRKLLLELDEMELVRLDRDEAGRPIMDNPVRFKLIEKGERSAKYIQEFKNVLED